MIKTGTGHIIWGYRGGNKMIPDPVFFPLSGPVFVPDRMTCCPVRYLGQKIEILSGPVRSGPVLSGTVGKYGYYRWFHPFKVGASKYTKVPIEK